MRNQSLPLLLVAGLLGASAHAAPVYTYAPRATPAGVAQVQAGLEPVLGPRLPQSAWVDADPPAERDTIRPDPAPARLHQLELVGFGTGAAQVQRAQQQLLAAHLPALRTATQVELVGHTDARGTVPTNDALGQRRAAAVQEFLASQQIPVAAERSAGKLEPLADNTSAVGMAVNRRVTLQYLAP